MEETQHQLNRRTVLQRGLAALAGLLGMDVIDPASRSQAAMVEPKGGEPITPLQAQGQLLRFHVHRWQAHAHGSDLRALQGSGRMSRKGELFDTVTGQRAGEFNATCFFAEGSFGTRPSTGAGVELHTFVLGADTLFGMGGPEAIRGGPQLMAVVGGTGRFAGARGSYVVGQNSNQKKGQYAEIVITLIS